MSANIAAIKLGSCVPREYKFPAYKKLWEIIKMTPPGDDMLQLLLVLLKKKNAELKTVSHVHPMISVTNQKSLYYTVFDEQSANWSKFFTYFGVSRPSFHELLGYIKMTSPNKITSSKDWWYYWKESWWYSWGKTVKIVRTAP